MTTQDEGQNQQEPLPHYRVTQKGVVNNIGVSDLESLVTHHPGSNRHAVLEDGVPIRVENPDRRSYGVVGGEIQEIEMRRTDGGARSTLGEHQVLLVKDFILEDSRIVAGGRGARDVDVPSPIAGYVGRINAAQGLVDIYDREGGDLIARMRHLDPIAVQEGDAVEYGQSLGTQNRRGLPDSAGKHVHLEMDTRYYQHYENYIADLTSGRLAIDPARRTQGIEPLPVVDDGTFRIGESGDRVRDLQRMLAEEGYRGRAGQPIAQDGIYRLEMQPAVLAFQRDHDLPQTGDIDRATLALAPMPARREPDRPDNHDPRHGPGIPNPPGDYGPPPHEHRPRMEGEGLIERLNPQERDLYDRGYAAVQARGGFDEEQTRNIAAAGVLAFNQSRSTLAADDVGIYGDRLRTTYMPYGPDKAPNFPADVTLADAAQTPAERSLQQNETLAQQRAQEQARQQDSIAQGQSHNAPTIGARTA